MGLAPVLAETTWVLSAAYALEHAEIATAVEMLLNHDQLSMIASGRLTRRLAS